MNVEQQEFSQLAREHGALLAQYGRVQSRCSEIISAQARKIDALEAECMRLRADVIVKSTALAAAQEDRASLQAAIPGLPRRVALAQRVDALVARVQHLMRERLRSQWRAEVAAPGDSRAVASAELHAKAVLCVGQDPSDATVAQRVVEMAGGQFLHHDGQDQGDSAALEASLVAADLVICQTGCVSHDAYWRVQDHCKRTGKQCVLVDQPQAMLFVRSVGVVEEV